MGWSHPKTDSLAFILPRALCFTPLSMAIIHSRKEARRPPPPPQAVPLQSQDLQGGLSSFPGCWGDMGAR